MERHSSGRYGYRGSSRKFRLSGVRAAIDQRRARFRDTFDVPFAGYYLANGIDRDIYSRRQEEIETIFHEHYEPLVLGARTRSGVRQTLQRLDRRKIKSIIFSNHTVAGVSYQIKRLGIEKYFSAVLARHSIAASDSPHEKRNKGFKLETYLEKNGYRKSEVLVVGDTVEEIDIAFTLGLKVAAITGGFCSTLRLRAAEPDFLMRNMAELEEIIKKIQHQGETL